MRAGQAAFDLLPEHLDICSGYELWTPEDLPLDPSKRPIDLDLVRIAKTIIRKISYRDPVQPGQDLAFLDAFCIAERESPETLGLFGTHRANKLHKEGGPTRPAALCAEWSAQGA